jgi:hypothetical protein
MLSQVPPPSNADVALRSARAPMLAKARWHFFKKYAPGLAGITIVYLFVTLLRSIRADFAPELWSSLGYAQTPATFTQSELLVSFGVVAINGSCIFIMNHYKAFRFSLLTSLGGFIILTLAVCGCILAWEILLLWYWQALVFTYLMLPYIQPYLNG